MLDHATVEVEVIVQDHFFRNCLDDESDGSPVTVEQWETWFHRWLETLQPALSSQQSYELSLRLTNDAEIQSLNAQYRQKDQPTDVLAFAALEVDAPQPEPDALDLPLYLGDIVISVETAQTQALQQNHSLQQELAWLASHALLHLLGWDHPDEARLVEMLKQQAFLLQTIGISSGYYQGES
jgi:probable rRNA maturation factor